MSDTPPQTILRLGARGSLLSRMQSAAVARAIEAASHGTVRVDLVPITTSGDRIQDKPLHAFGGKGLFTKELELALLAGDIDLAVHSFKDVPVTMPLVNAADLVITAVPTREDPRDVLLCATARSLTDLPPGARVGTGSLRRQAQLLALRPDLHVLPIRGNVDTRIRKLAAGEFDAIILAMAGIKRAGLWDEALMSPIDIAHMLPAAGQGALAIQCRRDAAAVRRILRDINSPETFMAAEIERDVVRLLKGDCHSPIGALARIDANRITLDAVVAGRDGIPPVLRASATSNAQGAALLADQVVDQLKANGAEALLNPP